MNAANAIAHAQANADAHGTSLASAPLTSSQRWQHTYGEMLIETRANGTVWIDGQLVRDTTPAVVLPDDATGQGPETDSGPKPGLDPQTDPEPGQAAP